MSFGVGRFEGLGIVASEGVSSSGKPGYVMKRVTIDVKKQHPCVCMFCINLRCLILGYRICALVTRDTRVGFGLN